MGQIEHSKEVIAANIAAWQASRARDSARREAFARSMALPFHAVYGEYRARKGDIFAVIAHTNRRAIDSPFRVKYCTIIRNASNGRLYAVESDEHGNPKSNHRRELFTGRFTGYKKTK